MPTCAGYLPASNGEIARRCNSPSRRDSSFCARHSGVTSVASKSNARKVLSKYGTPKHVDPIYGYLELVYECYGNIEYLRDKINELQRMVVPGRATREEVSSWVTLYDQERDRLQKYLADGARIGLEERQVRFLEQQRTAIVSIIQEMLDVPDLPDSVRATQKAVAIERLRAFSESPVPNSSPFVAA